MIDLKVIHDFREQINEHKWCFFRYTNNGNRNHWNCICSATDWIQVAAEYIHCHPLNNIRGWQSIELFSYIACVDIIIEAVEQLHRVIMSTKDRIFDKENDCFLDNQFALNDRDYFKMIRACFGAHPVNLDDPEDKDNKKAKRFASWSGGAFGPGDFSVVLYSNKIKGDSIFLGIKYAQLEAFAEKYYKYLTVLTNELENQYVFFCEAKRKEKFTFPNERVSQLKVLERENKSRLDSDFLGEIINDLLRIYITPITNKNNLALVEAYRKAAGKLIDDIHLMLQEMDIESDCLDYNGVLYPTPVSLPDGWDFLYQKIVESLGESSFPLYNDEWLKKYFDGLFVFDYCSTEELYVLINAALYDLSVKENGV